MRALPQRNATLPPSSSFEWRHATCCISTSQAHNDYMRQLAVAPCGTVLLVYANAAYQFLTLSIVKLDSGLAAGGALSRENGTLSISLIPDPETGAFNSENAVLSISVIPAPETGAFNSENAVLSISVIPDPATGAFSNERSEEHTSELQS